VKRVTRPMLGFKLFDAAQGALAGIELMHMIKKKQMMVEAGDEGFTAAKQFYALAASSPHRQGLLPLHDLLSKLCDRPPRLHPTVPERLGSCDWGYMYAVISVMPLDAHNVYHGDKILHG
jgi:hypothetical protein